MPEAISPDLHPSTLVPEGEPDGIAATRTIDGVETQLKVAPWTLLDALRDHPDLTDTKKACGRGQCGAGRRMSPRSRW
jgi:hypothetical protein